jgi:hypothetical protein
MSNNLIFDFNSASNIDAWRVVNDGVMGGKSKGNFKLVMPHSLVKSPLKTTVDSPPFDMLFLELT